MKKFLLLFAAISISLSAMSQKGKVTSALSLIDQGALDKAKQALDEAMVNEKSKDYSNTYFAQGKLCQAVYASDNQAFKSLCPDALNSAYAAYEKAIQLDPKGGMKKRIITGMVYNSLALDLYNQGSSLFEAKEYEAALKSFETQIKITESDTYAGAIDTGMYYNAGLAAVNSGKNEEAIKYFQKCADMKYLGVTPYFQISEAYLAMGDTVKAESILTGLESKFPGDKNIKLNLIDLFIKSGKNDDALRLLGEAKAEDPGNYSLYYAEGIIYLNLFKYDEAIASLEKSTELNPEVYDTQYGVGAAYINKASGMFTKANDIMDVNKYSAAIDEATAVFAKALPFMEKADKLKPNDQYTLQSLRELYYRLKMTDKYNEVKAKIEQLQQGQ